MSTRRPSGAMFNTVDYGGKSMGVRKVEARGPGRHPVLHIDTKAASDRTRRIPEAPKTGGLARDPHSHELDNRGWHDRDTDHRAAAPWATKEDFTPAPEKAFTPSSMRPAAGDFPRMEEGAAPPPTISNSNRGSERRPTRGRMQSAPVPVTGRRPGHAFPPPNGGTAAGTANRSDRRQTMPLTPARRPLPAPPSTLLAPELLHPQPRSPGRSSVSGSSLRQSAGLALVKGVDAFRSLASRAAKVRGSISSSSSSQKRKESETPAYQEQPSLAEKALMQEECALYAAELGEEIHGRDVSNLYARYAAELGEEIQGRDVSNLSPTSCELLYVAASSKKDPEERERAARAFAARQQVQNMPEAQVQAKLTKREMKRAGARVAHPHPSPEEEKVERYRMEQETRHEERARKYIAEQKNEAQRMVHEHPEWYPGLSLR